MYNKYTINVQSMYEIYIHVAKLSGILFALNLLSLQEKTAVFFKPCLILSTANKVCIVFLSVYVHCKLFACSNARTSTMYI